jgi:calcineurin-like phosphoesterase family protein
MSTFFTADWHLGDERQDILGRPFASAKEMQEKLIAEHNALVGPYDDVFIIGDALHSSGAVGPEALDEFNGIKTLIRGNHDVLTSEAYAPYVTRVIGDGEGIELHVGGIPCWLTHYPTQSRADLFNLVGHIHGSWRVMKNMLNVGVDVHHFRPITVDQVVFNFGAIQHFYDEDVWCSQLPANTVHDDRGKPGTYLGSKQNSQLG